MTLGRLSRYIIEHSESSLFPDLCEVTRPRRASADARLEREISGKNGASIMKDDIIIRSFSRRVNCRKEDSEKGTQRMRLEDQDLRKKRMRKQRHSDGGQQYRRKREDGAEYNVVPQLDSSAPLPDVTPTMSPLNRGCMSPIDIDESSISIHPEGRDMIKMSRLSRGTHMIKMKEEGDAHDTHPRKVIRSEPRSPRRCSMSSAGSQDRLLQGMMVKSSPTDGEKQHEKGNDDVYLDLPLPSVKRSSVCAATTTDDNVDGDDDDNFARKESSNSHAGRDEKQDALDVNVPNKSGPKMEKRDPLSHILMRGRELYDTMLRRVPRENEWCQSNIPSVMRVSDGYPVYEYFRQTKFPFVCITICTIILFLQFIQSEVFDAIKVSIAVVREQCNFMLWGFNHTEQCVDQRLEIWRYWTYQFFHVGWQHCIFNSIVILLVGIPLERSHGHQCLFHVFQIGVIYGGLAIAVGNPNAIVVGASGGAYALLGVHVANVALNWNTMMSRWCRLLSLCSIIATDIFMSLLGADKTRKVSHESHTGGLISGLLRGLWLLDNLVRGKNDKRLRLMGFFLFHLSVLTMVLFIGFYRAPPKCAHPSE